MSNRTARRNPTAALLADGLAAVRRGPAAPAAHRHVIRGVSPRGTLGGGLTVDDFVTEGTRVLVDTGRVYRYGDTIVHEADVAGERRLVALAAGLKAEPGAPALLGNLLAAGVESAEGGQNFLLPGNLTAALLASEELWASVPAIRVYARRPVFDGDFTLCGPGWNAAARVLVHGPDVAPADELPSPETPGGPADRLPRHLRELLGEFPWRGGADLVNAVALLLTGFLINHFRDDPHPIGLINGNQRGVGKTLLAQALGRALDGVEPPRIPLTGEEELAKRLGAQVLDGRSQVLLFDNVRQRLESAVLEQNALAPDICFRVLGRSATVSRPNSFLWLITANQAAATEDLVSRSVLVDLRYEGDPKVRSFEHDPLEYAGRHRLEILGELAAMVRRWVGRGRPLGCHRHRCRRWAALVGGILDASGLGQWFLAGQDEAAEEFDEGLQALATLAEHVVTSGSADFIAESGANTGEKGRSAGDWLPLFERCQLYRDVLAPKCPRARSTWVGTFLGAKLGRPVAIDHPACVAATLRHRPGRSRSRMFFFELTPAGDGRAARLPERPPHLPDTGAAGAPPTDGPAGVSRAPTPQGSGPQTEGGNDFDWGGA